ncbi:MAG: hypothetical protein BKP49_05455 [Treponema sp. CETP13]|nr:MAG: hypothetical protein BKP49_05455 [Treponema sp. CETP13]
MTKKNISLLVISTFCTFLFAYNPPASGEVLYELSTPVSLASASSVAGGGLWNENTAQIVINPSLLATEQRMVGNIAYTALINSNDEDSYGQSVYAGASIPTQYGVFTSSVQWAYIPLDSVYLGNSCTLRGAYSKDITDNLFVGAGLYGGFGSDWSLGFDLGFLYNFGSLNKIPFLSDVRWGGSLTGIGKSYNPETTGYVDADDSTTGIPSMFTPRTGVAATVLNVNKVKMGLSADVSFPTFQNVIFDSGLQVEIADFLYVNGGWEFNLRETLHDVASYLPSVSVSMKFGIASKDDSYLAEHGWSESEIVPTVAYRELTNDTQVFSSGVSMYLGLPDTAAPEITLWEEE